MKSRFRMLLAAITFFAGLALLFTALALPLRLAAQDKQDPNHKLRRYSVKDLGTLGGPNSVAPEAEPQPNEKGEVAGASDTATPDPNGEDFCGFGTHVICLPFIWGKGVLTALPTLGGNNGEAWQINNRGQIIGAAENTTQDPNCTAFTLEVEPVIWERGMIQELPPVSGDLDGLAQAINDRGQAVGISTNCPSELFVFPTHAVLWPNGPNGGVIDLGNLGSTKFNIAFGINNRAQVVGQSGLTGDMAFHAFLWQDGAMTDLGTLPGDVVSWAETINSKGEAVGTSFDANNNMHPFVWRDGMMTNLNTLIPPDSPWLLLEALGNNDRGQIVGYGLRTDIGEVHAYVATPCDEEHANNEGCEEGGGANTVPQPIPAIRDVSSRTLPLSLLRRMSRYHIPSLPTTCGFAGPGHCQVSGGRLTGNCITETPFGCSTAESSCFCPVGAMAINPGMILCCIHGNCGHATVDFGRFCRPTTPTPTPTVTPTATPTASSTPTPTPTATPTPSGTPTGTPRVTPTPRPRPTPPPRP